MRPLVLYAEDDENDAFFMQRAFAKLGRSDALRIVRDGKQALEYLAGNGEFADRAKHPSPSLVLLDVKMPRLSGFEVLRWLRSSPAHDKIPVVMFTSSTQDADLTISRQIGANAYIVKPANADHLAVLIDDLLSTARQLPVPNAQLKVNGNALGASPT